MEGTATNLLTSSYSGLSSLRSSTIQIPPLHESYGGSSTSPGGSGAEAWIKDRDVARRFFERSRRLDADLDVPLLPPSPETESSETESINGGRRRTMRRKTKRSGEDDDDEFQMPSIEIKSPEGDEEKPVRRRRRREDTIGASGGRMGGTSASSLVEERGVRETDEDDNTWYLYLPGLVGAGTALLVVGFLSFSSWRKGQGS